MNFVPNYNKAFYFIYLIILADWLCITIRPFNYNIYHQNFTNSKTAWSCQQEDNIKCNDRQNHRSIISRIIRDSQDHVCIKSNNAFGALQDIFRRHGLFGMVSSLKDCLVHKLLTGPIVTVCCIRSRYFSQQENVTSPLTLVLPPPPQPFQIYLSVAMIYESCISQRRRQIPYGLVVRIRRSHRRGPGSIPGVGRTLIFIFASIPFCPHCFMKTLEPYN